MGLRLFAFVCFISVFIAGCATNHPGPLTNREKAKAVLDNLGTADRSSLRYISDDTYIQHNLNAATGKAGLLAFLDKFPVQEKHPSSIVRTLVDGDYVVLQSNIASIGIVVFDIFRFQDGKIVEHWDNIQARADSVNPSGHTQTDGATQLEDLYKTDANKTLVKKLVQNVLIEGKFNLLPQYISDKQYTQHNPYIGDGIAGLKTAFAAMKEKGETVHYTTLHAVFGQGNFVLAVSEGVKNGTPTSFYDLFRVKNDKVVEHWDVVEPILPKEKQMNKNGKFNFPM